MTDTTISNGPGQAMYDTHRSVAASTFSAVAGQTERATHLRSAGNCEPLHGVDGLVDPANHNTSSIEPTLIGDLREFWRQRQDLHRAEKSLTLQIKAKCRRAMEGCKTEGAAMYKSMLNGQKMDGAFEVRMACDPFINARSLINAERLATEKMLEKLAKQLPVWEWVEQQRGFGAQTLAAIIGEAGDLSNYANPGKLWKRMGLAVIKGERQRKKSDVDGAALHGYSPNRRCLIWTMGDTMLRGTVRKVKDDEGKDTGERVALSEYGAIYLSRKLYERPRVESDGHAHNRAKRYMEKRVLRDLWRAWRDA